MKHQYLLYPGGRYKAVTFSYDDGTCYDIRLAQTLTSYGLKGTFNICGGFIPAKKEDDPRRLTAEEIRTNILDAGHEVAVHCAHHRAPGCVRPIEGIREVLDGRIMLEDALGLTVRGMAYPNSGIRYLMNGADKEDIFHYLKDMDIVYARSLGADNDSFDLPANWLEWIPTAHHANPKVFDWIEKFLHIDFTGAYLPSCHAKLFYLWGHSFEFENARNWYRLEEICQKLSGHEDIWYATNMEIYEYVAAYGALIYNAAGTRITNPTLQKIWLSIDGETYSIGSGQTLTL